MKVIIVEDEFLAQQELSWLIKEHSQMEIVGTFDDGLDVLKFLQHQRVDAIFLDINIPSLDGVLLAQNISQFAHKPFIVFIPCLSLFDPVSCVLLAGQKSILKRQCGPFHLSESPFLM